MDNKKIYIIHKRGAKRHFEAIENLKNEGYLKETVYLELNFFKKFVKGVLYLKPGKIIRAVRNFILFIYLLLMGGKNIVLSLEPFDSMIIFAKMLARNNRIIFFSSWPFWNGNRLPQKKKLLENYFIRSWKRFLSNVDVVTVTEAAKNSIDKFIGKNKTDVIPHCVNKDIFHPRKDYLNVGEKINILFVGRIIECKGISHIKKLIKELDKNKYYFNIVGNGRDKDLIDDVFKQKNVKYHGKIKDKDRLTKVFRSNDVLILPSYKKDTWEELFGIVLIEAMASGLVPVATDCVGPKEIIDDKINGLLIEQNNYKQLKEAVEYLQNNRKKLKIFKENSYEKSKKYSVKKCSDNWRREIDIL